MTDFIQEYFVNPILYQDKYPPYNAYNTLAYAAIAIAAVYLLFKLFKSKGIKIDGWFFKAVIPFVLFGSLLRVTEDARLLPRVVEFAGVKLFPFVTPGIYILTFVLLGLCMIAAGKMHGRGEEFSKPLGKMGWGLAGISFLLCLPVLLRLQNLLPFVEILALSLLVWFAFKKVWVFRGLKPSFEEEILVFSQALDGSATFVGVTFLGYSEQHVVGNAIFDLFGGPWAFLLIKLVFAFAVVEVIRRENVNPEEKTYLYLLISILGFGPGSRDALRMLAGV